MKKDDNTKAFLKPKFSFGSLLNKGKEYAEKAAEMAKKGVEKGAELAKKGAHEAGKLAAGAGDLVKEKWEKHQVNAKYEKQVKELDKNERVSII
jgi:hypothetical protein